MRITYPVIKRNSPAWQVLKRHLPLEPGRIIICETDIEFNSFLDDICDFGYEVPNQPDAVKALSYEESPDAR